MLEKILFERCVTQAELAAETGASPSMISMVVRGQRKPRPELRKRIAKALRVAPKTIFPFEGATK
jgi:transcriptional regulator with XRE-family HTH domain